MHSTGKEARTGEVLFLTGNRIVESTEERRKKMYWEAREEESRGGIREGEKGEEETVVGKRRSVNFFFPITMHSCTRALPPTIPNRAHSSFYGECGIKGRRRQ